MRHSPIGRVLLLALSWFFPGSVRAQLESPGGKSNVTCTIAEKHVLEISCQFADTSGTKWENVRGTGFEPASGSAITKTADLLAPKGEEGKVRFDVESINEGVKFVLRWTDFPFKGSANATAVLSAEGLHDATLELLDGVAKGSYPLGPVISGAPEGKMPYIKVATKCIIRNWNGRDLYIHLTDPRVFAFGYLKVQDSLVIRMAKEATPLATDVVEGEIRLLKPGEQPAP